MDFNDYQKEALRTANPECRNIVNVALGLCGESAEFLELLTNETKSQVERDADHLAKELGDIAWYAAVGSYILGYELSDIIDPQDYHYTPNTWQQRFGANKNQSFNIVDLSLTLSVYCGKFADVVKKHCFQGHELNKEKLVKRLFDIFWIMAMCYDLIGYKFEDGLQMNVDKLRKRYPDGFDAERSLHRKDGDV